MELKTLKNQTEYCLQNYKDTRNSDIGLTILVWKLFYNDYIFTDENGQASINLCKLHKLPNQDNIKRIRAKFQSNKGKKGKYLPTLKEIAIKRRMKEEEWRNFLCE